MQRNPVVFRVFSVLLVVVLLSLCLLAEVARAVEGSDDYSISNWNGFGTTPDGTDAAAVMQSSLLYLINYAFGLSTTKGNCVQDNISQLNLDTQLANGTWKS